MNRKRTSVAFCIAIVLGLSTMMSSTIYANQGSEDPVEMPKIAENNDQSVSNDTSNVEESELPQEEQPQKDDEPKLEEDRNLELDEPLVEADDTIDTSMFFVSNTGNDTNLGTKEKPFLTIEKAIETVDEGGTLVILSNLVLNNSIIITKNMKLLGMDTGSGKSVLTQNKEMTHMFVVEKAVVTFENIHFSGAGIDNTCTYENPFYGGAIYVKTDSTVDVNLCTFTEFEGYSGSAIFTDCGQNVNINVYNSNFENNIASLGGAAIGAETCFNYALRMTESSLINNHGDYKGGAIFINDSNSEGSQNIEMINSVFDKNTANNDGGAISLLSSPKEDKHIVLDGSTFTNNTSGNNGGAVHITGFKTADISNSVFENNVAQQHSGGVHLTGISGSTSQVNVYGNAFVNNESGDEAGAIRFSNGAINSNIGRSLFMGNIAHSNSGNAIVYLASSQNGTSSYIKPTDGAAFYQNGIHQDGEIIYVQMNEANCKVSLSKRMLDGTSFDWKKEEKGSLVPVDTTNLEDTVLNLYMNPNVKPMSLDPSQYSNIFIGNTAQYGGAISNYGNMQLGTDGKTIHVKKEWKGKASDYAEISLKRTQTNDILETIKLTKENNWQYDFDDFPTNVAYEIIEKAIPGYSGKIESNQDQWLITNTLMKQPDKQESDQNKKDPINTSAQTNTTLYMTLSGFALSLLFGLRIFKKKFD